MRRPLLFSLIPAGAVALLALSATDPYAGVTVDSGEYLSVADGLLHGHGLTMAYLNLDEAFRVLSEGQRVAMTQFPPLYPVLVAAFDSMGLSLLSAARVVDILCYFATVWIVTAFVWGRTRRAFPTILAGALFLAPDLLVVHAMAWSEAPFILAMAGCLVFTVRHHESRKARDLILGGVCAVLASLARFAGIALIAGVGVTLLLRKEEPLVIRARRAAAFVGLTSIPIVAWILRNAVVLGIPSEKEPSWHPPSPGDLGRAVKSIGGWVVPGKTIAMVVGALLLSGGLAAVIHRWRNPERQPLDAIVPICTVIGACYVAFLLGVLSFIDLNLALDTRLLSPLQVLVVIAVCCGVGSMARRIRWVEIGLAIVAVVSVARGIDLANGFETSTYVAYTGTAWRNSETLAYAGSLPDDTVIITNAPDPIWLWHRKAPQLLPPLSNLYTGELNDAYIDQLEKLADATRCRRGVVVFFDRPTRKARRFIHPLALSELRLEDRTRFADGESYEVVEPQCVGGR